jgi:plasmid stabilization system protein ParE
MARSVVPELNQQDIRELFVRYYRLVYKVDEHRVSILGFVHGARDFPVIWNR